MIDDNSIIDAGVGAFEGPIKQSVNSVLTRQIDRAFMI